MSIAQVTEDSILNLIFNATAWTGYAQNHSSPDANVEVSLQTADPTDSGTMSSSETTYTSYLRVARTRSNASGGWTASTTGSTSPHTTNIDFPAGTGGSGTVTFFSVGKSGGGAVAILWSGAVSPSIITGTGVTPRLTTATTITLD
jgi:hypothetical protein